jgi:lipid-binding SYLF domain-containing protein/peptidoglycan hydrolase-like protein with peptidoglycan-binding domain
MSISNLGIILLSSVLIFTLAPVGAAQSTTQDQVTMQKSATPKAPASKDAGTATTSKDRVREIQTALKDAGFDPGPIDGIIGPRTTKAIRTFQFHTGTLATGKLNDETLTTLGIGATPPAELARVEPLEAPVPAELAPAEKPAAALPTEDSEEAFIRDNLSLSSESHLSSIEDIRQVQHSLKALEYNPGEINGMMSSETQQAVREFQLLNGLPVTGAVDQQTKKALDAAMQGGGAHSSDLTQRQKPGEPAPLVAEAHPQTRDKTTKTRADTRHVEGETYHRDTRAEASTQATTKMDTKTSGKVDKDASERVTKAVEVLNELAGTPDKRIPNELLERAEAIAVIPNMIKGAFGLGGRYGKGVVTQRVSGRWSPPAFIEIGGGSFGAQIGVSSTDLVLIFTDAKALDLLAGGKDLKLGVDASVAAGPVGRSAEAGVNANLKTGVYAYSRAKGLFAGVALDGAVLDMDNSVNEKVYGQGVDAKSILAGNTSANTTVRPFMDAVERVVPKKKISQRD